MAPRSLSRGAGAGIASSRAVLLLQTTGLFTAPLTLLELYFAAREEKPIICLRLKGSSYDFEENDFYLQSLESNLYRDAPANAKLLAAWLDMHLITFKHVATTLSHYIPAIVTLPVAFSVDSSANQVAATLSDVSRLLAQADMKRMPSVTDALRYVAVAGVTGLRSSATQVVTTLSDIVSFGVSAPIQIARMVTDGRAPITPVVTHKPISKRRAAAAIGARWRAQVARREFQRMRWACVLIGTMYRGHSARLYVKDLRLTRDALVLIYFHVHRWIRRRRAAKGLLPRDAPSIQLRSAKMMERSLSRRRLSLDSLKRANSAAL